MNKFIALVVAVTLLFWGALLYKLTGNQDSPTQEQASSLEVGKDLNFNDLLDRLKHQTLDTKGIRNPFEQPAAPKPVVKVVKEVARDTVVEKPKPVKPKPRITLDAILPGDNPVAILKHNGESAVVSVGQDIWNVHIESISADKVTIAYDGGTLELAP
jgi:type IV secretory pathway VirB10-like protein